MDKQFDLSWLDQWTSQKEGMMSDDEKKKKKKKLSDDMTSSKIVNPKAGTQAYGSVAFADEKNRKYPIDSERHVRAALSYFSMPKNRAKYSPADASAIMGRIKSAAKKYGIQVSEEKKL